MSERETPISIPTLDPDRAEDRLERLRRLADDVGSPSLARDCERLRQRLYADRFTVAVVGEPGRGKSTVINRLLERSVLPERTAGRPTLVRLEAGDDTAWTLAGPGPAGDGEPVTDADILWSRLEERNGERPVRVDGRLEHPWLEERRLRITEIPSPAGVDEEHRGPLVDALVAADATLVVLNATAAFSATERQLLEERVLAWHTPRVAVVVTRLETVPEGEREELLDYVAAKLGSRTGDGADGGASVELCTLDDAAGVGSLSAEGGRRLHAGPAALRALLDGWATDPVAAERVQRQITLGLQELVQRLRHVLEERREAARLTAEERKERLQSERRALRHLAAGWDELELAHDRRRVETRSWLLELVDDVRDKTVAVLRRELRRSRPDSWWREELPERFESLLRRCSEELETKLNRRVQRDARRLAAEADEAFSQALDVEGLSATWGDEPRSRAAAPPELELTDLEQRRWLFRGLSLAAMPVSYFVLPVSLLGPAVAGGVMLLGERWMKGEIDRQREELSRTLEVHAGRAFEPLAERARREADALYAQVAQALRTRQEAWLEARREALERQHGPEADPDAETAARWEAELRHLADPEATAA